MVKGLALVGVIGIATTGCLWERNLGDRPARLQLGMNSRHIAVPEPKVPVGGYLERTTTEPTPTPESTNISTSAVTGSAQFTMQYYRGLYMGGEVEAGQLQREGSNFGALYGVAGAETSSTWGSLSVEVIAGKRWLRYELGSEDVGQFALEPRLRGQMWLTPQVSLGGVVGANAAPGENGWMAGFYFGVYSNIFNSGK